MKKIAFPLAALVMTLALTFGGATVMADGMNGKYSTGSGGGSTTINNQIGNTSSVQTGTPPPSQQLFVSIQNNAFSPSSISIQQGSSVTWTNRDSIAHTVTGDTSGGPNSGTLQPGASYTFTFSHTGTFTYHCMIHPDMMGSVTVTKAPTPTPQPSPNPTPGSGNTTQCQQSSSGTTYTRPNTTTPPSAPNYNRNTNINNVTVSPGYSTYTRTYTSPPTASYNYSYAYTPPQKTVTNYRPTAATATQPSALPSTGPAETIATFIGATFVGTSLYYLGLFRKLKTALVMHR